MGGDPNSPSPELLPAASYVDGRITLSFRRDLSAGGVVAEIETSGDLLTWTGGATVELVSSIDNGDGTVTVSYRNTLVLGESDQLFIRLRITEE